MLGRSRTVLRSVLPLLVAFVCGAPATATADDTAAAPPTDQDRLKRAFDATDFPREGWIAATGHFSLLDSAVTQSLVEASFGYGLRGGYRFGRWGVFGQAEHNLWVATELRRRVSQGAVNVAVGVEVFYFGGFARTSLAAGPSVLVTDTLLDEKGSTGLFIDGRPIGVHFPIGRHFAVTLDPLHIALVAPVLRGIPLAILQYRTDLALEVRW
jgi:hypothetical protein